MSDENTPEVPAFPEYPCSLGTVIAHEEGSYHIRTADGRVIGILARGELSLENVEADIADPAPVPQPVPEEVPAWRIKAVAKLAGLEPTITAALAALPEPTRTVASAAWLEGNFIRRDSATVNQLAAELAISPAQMDELFRQASALEV